MRTNNDRGNSPSSLEPTTQRFIDSLAGAPPLSTLTPEAAHAVLTDLQAKPVAMHQHDRGFRGYAGTRSDRAEGRLRINCHGDSECAGEDEWDESRPEHMDLS